MVHAERPNNPFIEDEAVEHSSETQDSTVSSTTGYSRASPYYSSPASPYYSSPSTSDVYGSPPVSPRSDFDDELPAPQSPYEFGPASPYVEYEPAISPEPVPPSFSEAAETAREFNAYEQVNNPLEAPVIIELSSDSEDDDICILLSIPPSKRPRYN